MSNVVVPPPAPAPRPGRRKAAAKAAEPERQNRARAVSELLPSATRAAFRRFGFVQSSVVSRWPEIVGPRYAHVSAPESIRFPAGERHGGTLNLVVRGAHAPMMQHIAPEIMERVNRFFGYPAVARVAIRQGDVVTAPPPAAPPSPGPAPAELGQSLRQIADPELKAVLAALAAGVAATHGAPIMAAAED